MGVFSLNTLAMKQETYRCSLTQRAPSLWQSGFPKCCFRHFLKNIRRMGKTRLNICYIFQCNINGHGNKLLIELMMITPWSILQADIFEDILRESFFLWDIKTYKTLVRCLYLRGKSNSTRRLWNIHNVY